MSYKVLHLVDHLNEYCGMSGSTINMITATRKQGFEGEIWSGPGDAFEKAKGLGIKVIPFEEFTKAKTPANIYRMARHINRYVKTDDIDVIHSHHRLPGFIGWFVAKWNHVPIVHTDHNLLYGYGAFSYWGDKVIAVSKLNERHLHEDFNIAEDKIVTCVEFADLDYLLEHAIEPSGEMLHIGQMGRLAEQKGQKYLLEGFRRYLEINDDVRLTIKGDGPLESELKEQAKQLDITQSVTFEAPDRDIKAFFNKIDCFLISSIFEGSCTVAAEAAAYGVPIISTDVGGITDYLTDGENAILIESALSEAIVEGLKRMGAMTADERYQLALNARMSTQKVFDRERQAQVLSDVYREVLNSKEGVHA